MATTSRPCNVNPAKVMRTTKRACYSRHNVAGSVVCRASNDPKPRSGWWPFFGGSDDQAAPPTAPPPLPPPPPPPPQLQQAPPPAQPSQPNPAFRPPPDPWSASRSSQRTPQQQPNTIPVGQRSKWDFFDLGSASSKPPQQPSTSQPSADPWAQRPPPQRPQQQARQQPPRNQPQPRQPRSTQPPQQQRKAQQQSQQRKQGWIGGQTFNERLYDYNQESNPQWRWPQVRSDQGTKDIRERIARITKRIQEEQRKGEVVLPPDFDEMDPRQYTQEMQRYIEYRRKQRMEKLDRANDDEIWGLVGVYMAIVVLVLAMSAISS